MKIMNCVPVLADSTNRKSCYCNILPAAALLCIVFFTGSSFITTDYKERISRWGMTDLMQTHSSRCKDQCRPHGSETLPKGIISAASNLEMRPLWGFPKKKRNGRASKSLLAIAVGVKQKETVNKIVKKFPSSDFTVMLFHYDGAVDEWRDLPWSDRALHVSAVNQTKWWFAKRFLHPDIVAEYEYIFLWDEDLGVEKFHPGRYFAKDKGSILAVGDITEVIPNEEADIAVLEEPEHLTWFHHGQRWKKKFRHVIGVVHTNYLEYVKREKNGRLNAFFLKRINSWVVNIFCHKVIRLSAATQDLPRSIICNVHGVNPKLIQIGKRKQEQQQNGNHAFTKGAYYIGKMVWSKGYRELLQLLSAHQNQLSDLQVDLYGDGGDSDQVQEAARKLKLAVKVYPGRDHADPLFYEYKVFLNPSTTDVVCTTTAEALAMGKIAICANHPSNDFFKQFPNCRMYNRGDEFVKATRMALADEPAPLTDDQRHELSWEAATERFVQAAELDQAFKERPTSAATSRFAALSLRMADLKGKMEDVSAFVHYTASGIEAARRAFGAVPGSLLPDEEQCKELGLVYSQEKRGSNRWLSQSS